MKLMKLPRKLLALALVALLSLVLTVPPLFADPNPELGVMILHTNDVHCDINADEETFGYADLAALKAKYEAEGYATILVDAGDALQGELVGTLSEGEYLLDIMNQLQYDLAVPGNHEFDFGLDQFFSLVQKAQFPYLACNFMDLTSGENVFDSYKIIEANGLKIGFVGISTPENLTKSNPINFQNEQGEYIYDFQRGNQGQDLYDSVQTAIDQATQAGADYIIAVGHLGIDTKSSPWTSYEVIAHTRGLDAFIDGHSHSIISEVQANGVVLASTGSKLQDIGTITINQTGISSHLLSKNDYVLTSDQSSAEYLAYQATDQFIKQIEAEYATLANTVVAKSEVDLLAYSPETEALMVRTQETNLGDLCADAYRILLGADIGFINGGGVRANLAAGDITFANIIEVNPFGNSLCSVEVSGQQILDALEFAVSSYPEPSGEFLQVSGLTYELHSYLPSSVKVTDNKEFMEVTGEYRVKNVQINGQPLELEKQYTLASHNYMLKSYGGGFTMFKDCTILQDEVIIDNQALIDYITNNLDGVIGSEYVDINGQGRIKIVNEAPTQTPATPGSTNPTLSTSGVMLIMTALIVIAVLAVVLRKKLEK